MTMNFRYRTQRDPNGTYKEELVGYLFEQNYQHPLLPARPVVKGFFSSFVSGFLYTTAVLVVASLAAGVILAVVHGF